MILVNIEEERRFSYTGVRMPFHGLRTAEKADHSKLSKLCDLVMRLRVSASLHLEDAEGRLVLVRSADCIASLICHGPQLLYITLEMISRTLQVGHIYSVFG